MLPLPDVVSLRIFIRVLSDCCHPLHLECDEYYFFIASKSGAESRVMGIATAVETVPFAGRFFCLHQTIYTLGGPLIKAVIAGSGHLFICTCNPCLCLLSWCEPWGWFLSCASALKRQRSGSQKQAVKAIIRRITCNVSIERFLPKFKLLEVS